MSVIVISVTLLFVLSGHFRPIEGKTIFGPMSKDSHSSGFNTAAGSLVPLQSSLSLNDQQSYARVYRLPDGEVVTKLRLANTTAIETQYNHIDLIQIIQGESIIQLWKSKGELIDCEFTSDPNKLNTLKAEFEKVNPNIHNDKKSIRLQNLETIPNLQNGVPQKFAKLLDYDGFVDECTKHHEKVREAFNLNKPKNNRTRNRRSFLIYPGTKWCGKGSSSDSFEDLGDSAFADRCCRDHDRCKYSIGSFETRYHLTNYGFPLVSHCSCDERFRSCLKLANSGTSNMVGKIFFNVVETKCFMFEYSPVCEESSWFGTCLRTRRRKRAVFRPPMVY